MTKTTPKNATQHLYEQIKSLLVQAKSRALRAVNTEMVLCYWNIGRLIVEEEQQGKERAEYGQYLIKELSRRLTKDFGKGFSLSNIKYFRQFYLSFTIGHAERGLLASEDKVSHSSFLNQKGHSLRGQLPVIQPELSWTHYRLLLKVEKPEAQAFYIAEAVNAQWSTRELERQIASLLFERLSLSKDKEGVLELARKGHGVSRPEDLVKDPYVLEFAGLKQDDRYYESEIRRERLMIEQESRLHDKGENDD